MQRDIELGLLDVNVYSHAAGRDHLVLYGSEPIFQNSYFPFMRRGATAALRSLADFDPLRLGHLAGLAYSPEFHAYVEARAASGRLDVTDSEAGNLRKLAAGRIDVFVSSVDTVRYYASRLGLAGQVAMVDFPVKQAAYYVTLSRASTRLDEAGKRAALSAIDGCLRQLKRTGRYEALRRPYQ
jgi:polar amino acid transport system substrate-binding protein